MSLAYKLKQPVTAFVHSNLSVRESVVIEPGAYRGERAEVLANGEVVLHLWSPEMSELPILVGTRWGLTPVGEALAAGRVPTLDSFT